jgi:AraC-like DNA-binding protein
MDDMRFHPNLIVLGDAKPGDIDALRKQNALTPIVFFPESLADCDDDIMEEMYRTPRLLLCHRALGVSEGFISRVRALVSGEAPLPNYTGALVKKAILCIEQQAHHHISRWRLADEVGVSEDYLTRIFRKETGLSLWEYINRYRVAQAWKLLENTGEPVAEIAKRCGFDDATYFCRVFKKITGTAPRQTRFVKQNV